MKGHLFKKEIPNSWYIAYDSDSYGFHKTEILLHPNNLWMVERKPYDYVIEVEFEIVRYCKKHNSDPSKNSVCTLDCGYDESRYARIITTIDNKIDLKKLESKLDEALSKETSESLTDWLKDKRKDDVYEMAQEYAIKSHSPNREARRKGFIDGYNKAKENTYTEEQVMRFHKWAFYKVRLEESDKTTQELFDEWKSIKKHKD